MPIYTTNTYAWTMPFTAAAGTTAGTYGIYYTGFGAFPSGAVDRILSRQEQEDEEDYEVDEDAWREFMMSE